MRIETIEYWHSANGPRMKGILINEGKILDLDGEIVPQIYDYRRPNVQVMTITEETHETKIGQGE